MGKMGWTGFLGSLWCCPVIMFNLHSTEACQRAQRFWQTGKPHSYWNKKKGLCAFDLINVSRILLREMGSRDVPFQHRQWRRLLQRRAECTHLTLQSSKALFIFLPLVNASFAPREKIIGNKKPVLVVFFCCIHWSVEWLIQKSR